MIFGKSKIRDRLLGYFFLNEAKKLYINEISRIIESDPKNVHRMLTELEKQGILKSEYHGKERYFYADKRSALYRNYKDIFKKTSGVDKIIRKEIEKIEGLVEAYIFGSFVSGTFDSESDIDLLLVGTQNTIESQKVISKIQKSIGREINAVNISPAELKKKKGKDQFFREIFSKKMIKI